MIYYSSPYRSDKNIGKANNDFIKLLPDDAWVCITDADAMFMTPEYGSQVEEIISQHGREYGLIGVLTNRLRNPAQLYKNEFSDDMDVRKHYEIAKEVKSTDVVTINMVAGVCMIFNKRVWKEVGGFREGIPTADAWFNKDLKRLGYRIGIAKGLYVFHSYRPWSYGREKTANDNSHLL